MANSFSRSARQPWLVPQQTVPSAAASSRSHFFSGHQVPSRKDSFSPRVHDAVTASRLALQVPSGGRRPRLVSGERETPFIEPIRQACVMCSDTPCISACEPGVLRMELPLTMATARIDTEACLPYQGQPCQLCVDHCPVKGAISQDEVGRPQINADACTGCGVCLQVCPAPPKCHRAPAAGQQTFLAWIGKFAFNSRAPRRSYHPCLSGAGSTNMNGNTASPRRLRARM